MERAETRGKSVWVFYQVVVKVGGGGGEKEPPHILTGSFGAPADGGPVSRGRA